MELSKLYQYDPGNTKNDPVMINPKGMRVEIPETRVAELLKKGYTLVDKKWRPSWTKEGPVKVEREVPKKLSELKEDLERQDNILEVIEI